MKLKAVGFVVLDDLMADDLSVVNAARVSFGQQKDELDDADRGLIRFLMRERHGTPFEHNAFRFHVKCPIFVAREWFRHRIGSFNEMSGRYKELPREAFLPDQPDVRQQVGKPGAYNFSQLDDSKAYTAVAVMRSVYDAAFDAYSDLLALGVAREQARMVLPVATFTEFFWTVNARSLMNFLSLRTDDAAQKEIRDYALQVEQIFAQHMPVTFAAWVENDKIAP